MLSKKIASPYEVLIEVSLGLSLLIGLIGGWMAKGHIGAVGAAKANWNWPSVPHSKKRQSPMVMTKVIDRAA
jgi:hypothetical protein